MTSSHPGLACSRDHAITGRNARKIWNRIPTFVNFAVGGACIAALGALLLGGLVRAGLAPLQAQAVQLTITLMLNFVYNYTVTWRDRPRTGLSGQLTWFLVTRGATQAVSWLAFAVLAARGLEYQADNAICLAGSMAVNFVTSDRLVFRRGRQRSHRRRASGRLARPGRRWVIVAAAAGICAGLYMSGLPTILLCVAAFNLAVGGMEARWRLYGWRTPHAAEQLSWPPPVEPGMERMTFSLIVPARDEARVIGDTLRRLLKQTHSRYQIVVSLCDDDEPTIEAVRAVIREHLADARIDLVLGNYAKPSKAQQLNLALGSCAGDVVGVIDAEDDVAEDLLAHVESLFATSDADVVQGGVQLMNIGRGPGTWFQVHNVLEYFFWFTSRMSYQADAGFVPLGGNTVFIRRPLLEAAGGWPLSLTEDCALGVRLSVRFGAKVATAYSAALTTREESPPTLFDKRAGSLFWQRDRWVRGFLAEFMAGDWLKMPTGRQRILAGYVLATPVVQAMSLILLALTTVTVLTLKTPVAVAVLMFTPVLPLAITMATQLIGLHDFCRQYGQRATIWHYASLLFLTPLYQVVLAAAASVAAWKYATGDTTWYKTGRLAEHRQILGAEAVPA